MREDDGPRALPPNSLSGISICGNKVGVATERRGSIHPHCFVLFCLYTMGAGFINTIRGFTAVIAVTVADETSTWKFFNCDDDVA